MILFFCISGFVYNLFCLIGRVVNKSYIDIDYVLNILLFTLLAGFTTGK